MSRYSRNAASMSIASALTWPPPSAVAILTSFRAAAARRRAARCLGALRLPPAAPCGRRRRARAPGRRRWSLRHGESQPHVEGEEFALVDGHGDPPLSEEGKLQAEQAAARLIATGERIAAVYVTTLQRTRRPRAVCANDHHATLHIVAQVTIFSDTLDGGIQALRPARYLVGSARRNAEQRIMSSPVPVQPAAATLPST